MAKLKKLTEQEMNSSKKRFKKLLEYSFVNKEDDLLLDEADDDPNDQNSQKNPNNQQGDTSGQLPNPNLDAPQGEPDEASTETQPTINPAPADSALTPQTQEIAPQPAPEPVPMQAPEDSVEIDVTDLANKQDDVDFKVSNMAAQNDKMIEILAKLTDKVQGIVKNTDSEMNKIKDEIIERNPTPVETLQKRITVSDPFSQTPEDYWNKKESEGHYRLSDDDNDNKEYVIKPSDIESDNVQDVYKSFGVDDDEMNQSLASMFRV
jgi:hypothetical protein